MDAWLRYKNIIKEDENVKKTIQFRTLQKKKNTTFRNNNRVYTKSPSIHLYIYIYIIFCKRPQNVDHDR